jgi:RimJ/RimL family protein N-acetyltransferase
MNYWQSANVRVRAIEPSDWEYFFKRDNDSERSRFLNFLSPPVSQESIKAWVLERSVKRLENDAYFWIILDNDDQLVGSIHTHHCNHRTGCFSYDIDIAPEYQKKGYATDAIYMVLRYYFEELRYQKVNVNIYSNNPASVGLHEKFGFKLEGTIRRMVFSDGRFYDELWYGMTREEFEMKAIN